jgi:hypothetical protein
MGHARYGDLRDLEAILAAIRKSGDTAVAAHGTREMPVWGAIFRRQGGTQTERTKIQAVTDYIESLSAR